MSIVVNNNIASLRAQASLTKNTGSLQKSMERLSTGYKINNASDNAAGLSISESLRAQIKGDKQAAQNIQDGINMLQTADGSLSVINDNLQRIRELCVQAANSSYATTEREAIITEMTQRLEDVTRLSKASSFNKIKLLDGSTSSLSLQIGAGSSSTNVLDIGPALPSTTTTSLGLNITFTGTTWTPDAVRSYMDKVDVALSKITTSRSVLGAYQNRLDSALENITTMSENLTSAESRIRDSDIAEETANMSKYQILQQASATVLSQSNQLPQLALSLLQG